MATENQSSGGIVLDTSLILRTVRYYSIIGAGLGLLGIVLMLQLGGGGDDFASSFITGILSMVVLAFAVLCGPLIAAFIGHATAGQGIGGRRARAVNSGIANGIGFAVFGIVVAALLWLGVDVLLAGGTGGGGGSGTTATATATATPAGDGGDDGGGSLIPLTDFVTLLVLMMIPNALVGGGITFFLDDRGGTIRQEQHEPEGN